MKKIIAILAISLMIPVASFAEPRQKAVPKARVMNIINEYRHEEGFDIVKIGSLGTAAIRGLGKLAARADGDEDIMQAIKITDGIRSFAIADFEECNEAVRDEITRKLSRALAHCEPVMEVKDDEGTMTIYGLYNEKRSEIKDFILYTPSDYAIICIFGTISMEQALELANED